MVLEDTTSAMLQRRTQNEKAMQKVAQRQTQQTRVTAKARVTKEDSTEEALDAALTRADCLGRLQQRPYGIWITESWWYLRRCC